MKEKILEICREADDSVDFSQTNLVDGKLIDSITLVTIATSLMEEFEVEIPYEEIIPQNFNSVEAMAKLVEKYA